MAQGGQGSGVSGGLAIPRSLHKCINFLCYFMIFWSLVFPMSWVTGVWEQWGQHLAPAIVDKLSSWTSSELVSKYKGHAAVTLTHNLPSALWAALVIVQLSNVRKTHPRAHRVCGYMHTLVSFLLMVGVAIMQMRKLYFSMHPAVVWFLELSAAWFLFSLCYAILAVRANLYRAHRAWMLRHIASGIWVAMQRLLYGTAALLLEVARVAPQHHWHRHVLFGSASVTSFMVCVAFCEVYLWVSASRQQRKVKVG